MNKKICSRCREEKEFSDFTKNKNKIDGLSGQCKVCRNEYRKRTNNDKIYKKNHRDDIAKRRLIRLYKLAIKEKEHRIKSQNGKCPICERPVSLNDFKNSIIDHNHVTGKTRGILCNMCNVLLGFARENTEILKRAIIYLNFWENKI